MSKEAETQKDKTKREAFLEKLGQSHPDVDFGDDEAIFGAIDGDYGDRDSKISKFEEEGKKVADLFGSDPRSAQFFSNWSNGGDPVSFLMENFGDDFKEALDDPDKKDAFAEKYSTWLANVASSKELEKQADENMQATLETLDKLQEEQGWDDETTQSVFNAAHQIFLDGVLNIIKPETFIMISKALNHDTDVEEAARVGEIKGKNAKIEDKIKKEEAPAAVPTLGGGNDATVEQKPKEKEYNPFLKGGK